MGDTLHKMQVIIEATTKPLKKEMEEGQREVKKTVNEIQKETEKIKNPFRGVESKALQPVRNTLNKIREMIGKNPVKNFQIKAGIKVPTEEYAELQENLSKAQQSLEKLQEKQRKFENTGKSKENQQWKSLVVDITQAEKKLNEYKDAAAKMEMTGTALKLTPTNEYREIRNSVKTLNEEIEKYEKKGEKLEAMGVKKESKQWRSLIYDIADARKYIIKHFTEAGKFTWEGFKNGVVQSFKDIGTWIKAHIFKPFINGFKKAFGIHSPSTVMRTQGGYVISGLFNGMKAGLPAVLSWIAKLPGQTKERLGNAKTWLRGKGNAAITGLKNGWEAVRESTFLSRVKKIASQSFNAIGDIKSKVTPKGRDIISGMRTGLNNNWSSLSGILSNIPGKVANAIPSLYTVGQNVIQTFANGFSSIHIPMPHINWDWEGGSIKIGNFKFSLPRFNLSWYANGGFPGMGEMFVARESGPELVGRMGNRSAVANNNQIIAGIRAGVFEAVVNAFESMQGRNDRGQELHIYLEGDAKKLFKVIRQEGNNYQKQTGNPVFG